MQLYVVGGAVRDRLLGLPAADRDWVAVGTTPEELRSLGYQPVGRDFPVFLHPETHEEVALARTERKVGRGYHGFTFHAAPEVTLEEDLARRDLTINAMAEDAEGRVIDPFGGQADLAARVLRHVSPAFVEDPVRLLRLARLAARFPDFRVAPETEALLRQLVEAGEVDALVPERVWQELSRGLMAARPSRMLGVLLDSGALARLWPGLEATAAPLGPRLDAAADRSAPLPVRLALLLQPLGEAAADAASRLRADGDSLWLAARLPREHAPLQALAAEVSAIDRHDSHDAGRLQPLAAALLQAFERNDALRRPGHFERLLVASDLLAAAPAPQAQRLLPLLQAARALATGPVAAAAQARGEAGAAVGEAVAAARRQCIAAQLATPAAL